jgi:hypothetical protein
MYTWKLLFIVAIATLSFLILGCGGGNTSISQFAGTYSNTITSTRLTADTTVTIFVANDGTVTVVVSDSDPTLGLFNGTGVITADGHLLSTVSNDASKSITLSGEFASGTGIPTSFTGSLSGNGTLESLLSNVNFTADQIAPAGKNIFAGNYTGTFGGDSSGTWSASVDNYGKMTASIDSISLSGTVSSSGAGNMSSVTGGGNIDGDIVRYIGRFYLQGSTVKCSGTWTDTYKDESGTYIDRGSWKGQKTP